MPSTLWIRTVLCPSLQSSTKSNDAKFFLTLLRCQLCSGSIQYSVLLSRAAPSPTMLSLSWTGWEALPNWTRMSSRQRNLGPIGCVTDGAYCQQWVSEQVPWTCVKFSTKCQSRQAGSGGRRAVMAGGQWWQASGNGRRALMAGGRWWQAGGDDRRAVMAGRQWWQAAVMAGWRWWQAGGDGRQAVMAGGRWWQEGGDGRRAVMAGGRW